MANQALIYIHGFLSSPLSYKAQQVQHWLQQERPDISYHCPHLTPYPQDTQQVLDALVQRHLLEPVYLIGSSLGGYWATYLAEKYQLRAVLVNPSVQPYNLMRRYLDVDLKGYHTDDSYRLSAAHIEQLRALEVVRLQCPANYWLMVQTGDETLDYRQAVTKYRHCKQTVEEGGDHSFQYFERWLPHIMQFFEAP